MFIITNGKIVLPDSILEGGQVWIVDDRIHQISQDVQQVPPGFELIDAKGGYITAGFIDIHSDYIEHMTAPRPSSLMDFRLALREAERELLTHGVTTMYHSLSLYKEKQVYSKPIRKRENVERLIRVIAEARHDKHLIRHRFHARFEVDNVDSVDALIDYIESGQVDLLSFMDHTPGQGQYRDIDKYKEMSRSYGSQLSETEFDSSLEARQNKPKLSLADCEKIAQVARKKGVAVASHDDDTTQKIDDNKRIGATISEFPITLEVATYAHRLDLHTVAGAPNVLLGGSHSGNMAAYQAVDAGVVDVLCSDYYPAALLHAVFKLHYDYDHPLHQMFKLVTLNAAKAVGIDDQVGSIEVGKKADIVIIDEMQGDIPVITNCFVDGKHIFETRYRY